MIYNTNVRSTHVIKISPKNLIRGRGMKNTNQFVILQK